MATCSPDQLSFAALMDPHDPSAPVAQVPAFRAPAAPVQTSARLPYPALDAVTRYAVAVVQGDLLTNTWVRLACRRHLDDLRTGRARGLAFNPSAAQHAITFFAEFLWFYEGEWNGTPFLLQPWQDFLVGSLFGWKVLSGDRRFRTAYIEAAKGCGKTPLAAGIGLYGIICDAEPGAEVYSAAVTREQAGILFRDARAFSVGSEALRANLTVGQHNITHDASNSFFRPVSSEHRGLDGKRPHIALIDEIHEHPDGMVVDKMRAGTKGRRQALIFEITNAGYDRHSVCYQHHDYSEKILNGIIDNDSWFAYMTGLDVCDACAGDGKTVPQDGCPTCDDWRNPAVWPKANPNLGISIKPKYLEEQVAEAMEIPSKENITKRLNFCVWTESITRWLTGDAWAACGLPVDAEALRGRTAYGGLDLSTNTDLTAWVLVFPPIEGETRYQVLARFFLPAANASERIRKDKVPYDVWVRDGWITLTTGNIIDYAFVLDQIRQDSATYHIAELAFDRWGSAKITTDLQDLGFEVEGKKTLVMFGQGFASMSAPTREVEKMTLAGEIAHGGNPVLSWMVSNVAIREDPAGNKKPDKEKSTERIDGAVAMIMAVGRAMLRQGPQPSIYETRGVISL